MVDNTHKMVLLQIQWNEKGFEIALIRPTKKLVSKNYDFFSIDGIHYFITLISA